MIYCLTKAFKKNKYIFCAGPSSLMIKSVKIFKIILFFILLALFTSLNADEAVKSDNSTIKQDVEFQSIDLEEIKRSIKPGADSSGKEKDNRSAETVKKKASDKSLKKADAGNVKKDKAESGKIKKPGKTDEAKPAGKSLDRKNIPGKGKSDILTDETGKETVKPGKSTGIKKVGPPDDVDGTLRADTLYINPTYSSSYKNRLYIMNYSEIAKWGKLNNLVPYEDSAPFIDGLAFFMPDFYSEFTVENYDRELIYKIVIDFVKYKGSQKPINSLLKIWGRDISGRMILIAEINQEILKERELFEVLIPYELSSPGRFDIIIREYSDTPGKWGIWDIIVTARKIQQIDIQKPDISGKMKSVEQKIFK